MNWKRILAREWLLLLGCTVGGVVLLLGLAALVGDLSDFRMDEAAYLLVPGLLLYGLVQLVRSVVWAVRTLRRTG